MNRRYALGLILLAQTGCAELESRNMRHDPAFAPVPPQTYAPIRATGAIYQANNDLRLFENTAARRVGDLLTIRLTEKTTGQKNSTLTTQKKNDVSASVPTLFGMTPNALFDITDPAVTGQIFDAEAKTSKKFNGQGIGLQNNSLSGSITVTVAEVLPNGNLRVQGEKRLTINQGAEYVRLSGIVRPADIDATNTVASTQVADATIIYTGTGTVADASEMGWLARFFNSVFFPF
jgi:flagellar L-ring protein precursor FlgH